MKNYGIYKINLTSEGYKILQLNTEVSYAIVPAGRNILLVKTDEPVETIREIEYGYFSIIDHNITSREDCFYLQDQQQWLLLLSDVQMEKNINLQRVKAFQPKVLTKSAYNQKRALIT